jgi:excisionase family DNA binding protein
MVISGLPNKALLTVPETAATLAVSRHTIYRFLQRGELDAHKIGVARCNQRSYMRVTRASIERFLADPARRME